MTALSSAGRILQVDNLSKTFGSSEVLNNISFSLSEGEALAVIGASGSGKTTLLRCLNFLERPDSGRIAVRGEPLYDSGDVSLSGGEIRHKRLHFGLVFQAFNLFPQYTALQNVTLARELAAKKSPAQAGGLLPRTTDDINNVFQSNGSVPRNSKKETLDEIRRDGLSLLEQVGLSSKRDFYPHQLSGGQQQRVAIARALAMKPDILCFDEPTSALDPELTGEVLKVIRNLAEKRTTMIIVTHEMEFARQAADTIMFMDEGQVVEYGTPAEVFENTSNSRMKRFLERYDAGV